MGVPGLGWVALKFLLQMWDTDGGISDHTSLPLNCNALLKNGGDPTTNVETYAYMASMAYDLGLKTDGPYYGDPCRSSWNPNP